MERRKRFRNGESKIEIESFQLHFLYVCVCFVIYPIFSAK